MAGILRSFYCLPCIWSILCALGTFAATSYIRNSWVPGGEPTPSDGPVEGFESQAARIAWWDTHELRIRTSTIYALIGFITWGVGAIVLFLVLNSMQA